MLFGGSLLNSVVPLDNIDYCNLYLFVVDSGMFRLCACLVECVCECYIDVLNQSYKHN